jgi:hypothetical protein
VKACTECDVDLPLLLLLPQELGEAHRVQEEYQAKVEKIMGQVIAADTSKEHYRQKVSGAGGTVVSASC